jgi:hypothetical protein
MGGGVSHFNLRYLHRLLLPYYRLGTHGNGVIVRPFRSHNKGLETSVSCILSSARPAFIYLLDEPTTQIMAHEDKRQVAIVRVLCGMSALSAERFGYEAHVIVRCAAQEFIYQDFRLLSQICLSGRLIKGPVRKLEIVHNSV